MGGIAAPRYGTTRQDLQLWQDSSLGDCGQFDLIHLENDKVAFKTCAGKYITPGNDTWSGLEWSVIAETIEVKDWEKFTLEQQR